MININNTVYVDFICCGKSLLETLTNFNYLIVEEQLGLEAPVFEISLTLRDASFLSNFKINTPCIIKFGRGKESAVSYHFLAINYTMDTEKGEGGGFQITISGIADVLDFYFKKKIQVFNNKASYEVLKEGITTLNADIDYISSDKQNWIRYNISERQFVLDVLQHTWISPETFPIFGVTIDKKLKVKDAKKALEMIKATVQNTDKHTPTNISYNGLHIESNNAITSMFLGSGKLLPILGIKDWKRNFLTTDLNSLNGKNYFGKTTNTTFKTHINTYSTHSNYFTALARNLSKWSQLEMNNMYINTPLFISEKELTLCDAIKFISSEKEIDLKVFNGNWIVSGKTYRFGKRDISTRLKFSRDFL